MISKAEKNYIVLSQLKRSAVIAVVSILDNAVRSAMSATTTILIVFVLVRYGTS